MSLIGRWRQARAVRAAFRRYDQAVLPHPLEKHRKQIPEIVDSWEFDPRADPPARNVPKWVTGTRGEMRRVMRESATREDYHELHRILHIRTWDGLSVARLDAAVLDFSHPEIQVPLK